MTTFDNGEQLSSVRAKINAAITKVDGIESGATADQTGAEIKTAYEAESDTNAFTDADVSKLSGVEPGSTADQTGAEIKASYEAEPDTNAFTDANSSKLAGIEANATADQTGAEIKAAYDFTANVYPFADFSTLKLGTSTYADGTLSRADFSGTIVKAVSTGAEFTNAGGQGFVVVSGPSYAKRDSTSAGDFALHPNGVVGTMAGDQYVTDDSTGDASATSDLGVDGIGLHAAWRNQKHLLSADWQPREEAVSPGEAARFQSVLDSIAGRHPDLTHAHLIGDLVDRASLNNTGGAAEYGFPEFLADWRTRLPIPLSNAFFLPGNHDRDGTGLGLFEDAWSMNTYREWMGPEYYHTVQGNLMNIYMGDMGGSNPGAITDSVVGWLGTLLRTNKDKNIVLHMHQPLSGTYQGQTEATNPTNLQVGSARITAILDEIAGDANNVAALFYGHVGSSYQFNDETFHGTRHIQIGMHIPSNVNEGRNDQYYVMHLAHGSSTFDVVQWDATTDTELVTKTITLAYPLQLGETYSFDGRTQSDQDAPKVRAQEIMVPVDTARVDNGGTWELPANDPLWLYTIGAEDRSLDDIPNGFEIGLQVKFPGSTVSGADYDQGVLDGVAVSGLGFTWENITGSDAAPDVVAKVWTADNGVVTSRSQFSSNGLHVGHTRSATQNPGNDGIVGATVNKDGFISAYRSGGIAGYFGRGSDGDLVEFNNGTSRAGVINITGTTTAYNTTSDERLKCDLKDFDGLAAISALRVYDYSWVSTGSRAKGVMAQEAYGIAPYAVSVGGDDVSNDPWMVDYSKLVPDLIRAVQQLSERVDELERE